jgi:hypothetical protein
MPKISRLKTSPRWSRPPATELGFMRWGVEQACRAWLREGDVANTRGLEALLRVLHERRR